MSTIMDLPETFELNSDDYVLVEYNGTAYRIPVAELLYGAYKANGFGDESTAMGLNNNSTWSTSMTEIYYRRQMYRGKFLGTSMTQAHFKGLSAGAPDLYLGDWWVLGGNVWRVVDFDYVLGMAVNDSATNPEIKVHTVQIANDPSYMYFGSTSYDMPYQGHTTPSYTAAQAYSASSSKTKATIEGWLPNGVSLHTVYERFMNSDSNYGGGSASETVVNSAIHWFNEYQLFGRAFLRPMTSSSDKITKRLGHRNMLTRQMSLFKIAPEFIFPMYNSSNANGYALSTTTYANVGAPNYGFVNVKPNGTVGYAPSGANYYRIWFNVTATI